jgi:restriction system protein
MLALAAQPSSAKTKPFQLFRLPLREHLVEEVLAERMTVRQAVERHWQQEFASRTFQNPDKIRSGFAHVADVNTLWGDVANMLNEIAYDGTTCTGDGLQAQLKDVVFRRNKIAHEYDEDPDNRPVKRPIDAASTTRAIRLIEQLAEALVVVLNGKS